MLGVEDTERKDTIFILKDPSPVREFIDKHHILVQLTNGMLSCPWIPSFGVHERTPAWLRSMGAGAFLHLTPTPWHHQPTGFPVLWGFMNLLVLQGGVLSSPLMLLALRGAPRVSGSLLPLALPASAWVYPRPSQSSLSKGLILLFFPNGRFPWPKAKTLGQNPNPQ